MLIANKVIKRRHNWRVFNFHLQQCLQYWLALTCAIAVRAQIKCSFYDTILSNESKRTFLQHSLKEPSARSTREAMGNSASTRNNNKTAQ